MVTSGIFFFEDRCWRLLTITVISYISLCSYIGPHRDLLMNYPTTATKSDPAPPQQQTARPSSAESTSKERSSSPAVVSSKGNEQSATLVEKLETQLGISNKVNV